LEEVLSIERNMVSPIALEEVLSRERNMVSPIGRGVE
jgi:hypothetical protein